MYRVHIVGISPRTGTSLIAQCMRNCFEISASEPHEASLFKCRGVDGVYLTKQPYDLRKASLRLQLDRRLHVICMVRDPRDVVTSVHRARQGEYFVELNVWKKNNKAISQISHLRNLTIIRYEDLVSDPESVQATIGQRMPFLSKTQDFTKWYVDAVVSERAALALNGVRPIDNAALIRWRKHTGRVRQQLSLHGPINDELISWGYEKDDQWMQELSRNEDEPIPVSARKSQRWRKSRFRRRMRNGRYFISAIICAVCDRLGINYG